MKNKRLGAFIVPTGIGASVGGYAGDASVYARKFAKHFNLIVNPNVVNAGGFSGITQNMLYVEGFSLDEFFKGNLKLVPSIDNKVGIVFDKGISEVVMNIHINTLNAVKTVYGVDVVYETTAEDVGVEFYVDESGISTGTVKNIKTVLETAKSLQAKGASAIAIVCKFADDDENEAYDNGMGVDPIGGAEAIISHSVSKELQIPAAHAPAFENYSISTKIVSPKSASEYITPTFLPCILLGLSQAPQLSRTEGLSIDDLEFLVMPYNALGSIPVLESLKRNKKIFAVKENESVLDVTKEKLHLDDIIVVDSYDKCLEILLS
ncbi:DUF3326 domain-containing protein [bacterium]|nr:DUF3326 domain-containing protein [bacterium]